MTPDSRPCRPVRTIRRRFAGVVMLGAAVVVVSLPVRGRTGSQVAKAGAQAGLTVVFSGDLNGYLSPCGCTKPMLGGMDRRGALLGRLRKPTARALIAVENGDLTPAGGRQDELKAEALADMLGAMRYDAVGVGERDLALGFPFLIALQARSKAPFICANVTDGSGNPVFSSHVVVSRSVGGKPVRVAVAAALSPRVADDETLPPGEFIISDPKPALRQMVRDTSKAQYRILLFHGRRNEAASLGRAVTGFDLIVYAHGPDVPAAPLKAAKSLLVCAGSNGKYVGVAQLRSTGAAARHIPLGESLGSDPAIVRIRRAYLARVTSEDLLGKVVRRPSPDGAAFAGSEACAPCHAEAHRAWRLSSHSRALRTLAKVGQDRDPECVPCHVTGMQVEGGYRHGDARLADVGCESCHRPSASHAKTGQTPAPPRSGPDACRTCHVPDHSPDFRFDAYWSRIRH